MDVGETELVAVPVAAPRAFVTAADISALFVGTAVARDEAKDVSPTAAANDVASATPAVRIFVGTVDVTELPAASASLRSMTWEEPNWKRPNAMAERSDRVVEAFEVFILIMEDL